jgi:sarcosine oxidase gamma subunit
MTASGPPAPVRRSALETVHRGLGGSSLDVPFRWPMSYGDPDGERRAVATSIGLAEPGLYDKWVVRGRGSLTACRSDGLEGRSGHVTSAQPGGINVWAIAEDEVWLVAYAPIPGGPTIAAVDFGRAVAHLRRSGSHVTDVSSGWAVLRLVGPRSRDLLEELVPENLTPSVVPDHAIQQVPIAGCRAILARIDHEGIPGFTLLIARDEAEYLWDVFMHLGEAYDIRAVGASALLPAAPEPAAPESAAAHAAPRAAR